MLTNYIKIMENTVIEFEVGMVILSIDTETKGLILKSDHRLKNTDEQCFKIVWNDGYTSDYLVKRHFHAIEVVETLTEAQQLGWLLKYNNQ